MTNQDSDSLTRVAATWSVPAVEALLIPNASGNLQRCTLAGGNAAAPTRVALICDGGNPMHAKDPIQRKPLDAGGPRAGRLRAVRAQEGT